MSRTGSGRSVLVAHDHHPAALLDHVQGVGIARPDRHIDR